MSILIICPAPRRVFLPLILEVQSLLYNTFIFVMFTSGRCPRAISLSHIDFDNIAWRFSKASSEGMYEVPLASNRDWITHFEDDTIGRGESTISPRPYRLSVKKSLSCLSCKFTYIALL